jgi:hypothetical protein
VKDLMIICKQVRSWIKDLKERKRMKEINGE